MGNLLTAAPETVQQHSEEKNDITTWNGALSYDTVDDPLVELFFKSVRGMNCEDYRSINVKTAPSNFSKLSIPLEEYFDEAWESDPLRTLKFVFYLRDCRNGKGEKELFRALIRHMRERDLGEHVSANMEHIPTFGSWKDIPLCFLGTELSTEAINLIAKQLNNDIESDRPSLCAKYAPTEGGTFDRNHRAADNVAKALGVNLVKYRKEYLVPLRAKLNIVEREMCKNNWTNIDYERVPSIAGSRYKNAFSKHDESRYSDYLKSVQKGEKKMNTSVLMPYQMVAPYLRGSGLDETIEAQWKSFVDNRREKWSTGVNVLPLVDVSGSMFNDNNPQAVEVAVSLGLLFSILNASEHYKGKFITFHESPELLSVKGDSLQDQVSYMKSTKWGGSTNFQEAFDLILNTATIFQVPEDQMPQILLVLSDMQFNQADNNQTNWNEIESRFEEAGYTRPTIIFWNLSGNTSDYPVPDKKVSRCALVSGYNDVFMYSLLDGTMPNPRDVVIKALDHPRYDVIKLSE
jgi:Mg-chelatase subunit ChlD